MARQESRAISAFFLVLLAAGLNISSASSTGVPTPSDTFISGTTKSSDQATISSNNTPLSTMLATTAPILHFTRTTLSQQHSTTAPPTTALTMEAFNTTSIPTVTPNSTTTTNMSSDNLPLQPSTELQTTEDTLASVTSISSLAAGTIPHSETPPVSSSNITLTATNDTTNVSTVGVTWLSSTDTSSVIVPTNKFPIEETTSGVTLVAPTSPASVKAVTFSQVTLSNKATQENSLVGSTTFTTGVTMQEVQRALSSGSIAAITITVIAVVLLVFGIAAFLKIRHSSYGRLLDDHDYGSWGNYNNPLYDDS